VACHETNFKPKNAAFFNSTHPQLFGYSSMGDSHQSVRAAISASPALASSKHLVQQPEPSIDGLYRRLVESLSDYAVLILDPNGNVTSWNAGAEQIKGYSADEIIGRHFAVFYPDEAVRSGWPEEELRHAATKGRFEDEGWRVRKDGTRFWANVVITALRDDSGRLIAFGKVTRDLTARRLAEEQARRLAAEQAAHAEAIRRAEELEAALLTAQEARAAAERATAATNEAYRELDQFAYVASHDLKAPLRGINNLAQWIQDDLGEELDGESAEHLRLLQGRVHRMEALIDGILAYSRAGRVRNAPEPVDTGALVREVIELLAPPPEVEFDVCEQMPVLEAERVPLQQVFLNLLGNAVKYGRAERDDVTVCLECRDLGDAFEFAVRDNGPGIDPEYHERIWGIFQTLAARDKVEGTGIGLSIVKKVIETRGGRVALESAPGRGATFRFTWPKTPRQGQFP
jgi:PAS domain S-box-containing protein